MQLSMPLQGSSDIMHCVAIMPMLTGFHLGYQHVFFRRSKDGRYVRQLEISQTHGYRAVRALIEERWTDPLVSEVQ